MPIPYGSESTAKTHGLALAFSVRLASVPSTGIPEALRHPAADASTTDNRAQPAAARRTPFSVIPHLLQAQETRFAVGRRDIDRRFSASGLELAGLLLSFSFCHMLKRV